MFKYYISVLYITVYILGSPADRADLEVWDEILEVNGRSLENCTHAEAITFIHKVRNHETTKLFFLES